MEKIIGKTFKAVDVSERIGNPIRESKFNYYEFKDTNEIVY